MFIERRSKRQDNPEEAVVVKRIASSDYMDEFINPPDVIEQRKQRLEEERKKQRHFPAEPQKDVLLFLIENAPLENWQREILWMIREEAYYFAPQAQTTSSSWDWGWMPSFTDRYRLCEGTERITAKRLPFKSAGLAPSRRPPSSPHRANRAHAPSFWA